MLTKLDKKVTERTHSG